MILCGLDLETSGLNADTDEILEIGLCLWDTDEKKPLKMESLLIKDNAHKVNSESYGVNHISQFDLEQFGTTYDLAMARVEVFFVKADYVVAHNGNLFDKPFLLKNIERRIGPKLPDKYWIDTSVDIIYPEKIKTRSLSYLATEHGFMNPFAHRALFDVLTMLRILSFYDIEEVVAISRQPNILLQAIGQKPWDDGGKSNDEIRSHGYRWDGGSKKWLKTIKEGQLEQEIARGRLYKAVLVT